MNNYERLFWCVAVFALFTMFLPKSEPQLYTSLPDSTINGTYSPLIVNNLVGGVVIPKPLKEDIVYAEVTGYKTLWQQTDDTPCIGASGDNICKLKNTIACPRSIPLYTQVVIDGVMYTCLDRLALKYDDRFDINFGLDVWSAIKYGKQYKKIIILDN
jgi:hypothetical protein